MTERNKKENPKINIFKKIKLSKNMSIVVSIILGIVAILIFTSTFDSTKENKNETSLEYTTMMEYTKEMEQKLKNVILAVDGVDSVEVMITFESSIELIISTTKETKTISSGNTETILLVETPVLVNQNGVSKPIVLQEKLPAPKHSKHQYHRGDVLQFCRQPSVRLHSRMRQQYQAPSIQCPYQR